MSFPDSMMRLLLRADNLLYKIISSYSVRISDGVHPKHGILKYYAFFVSEVKDGSRILDVGCGTGLLAKNVAKRKNVHITGIDLSQQYIAIAKKRNAHPRVEHLLGDATTYGFEGKYEYVILSNVLEHIKNRVVFLRKLKKLAPVLLIRVPMLERHWLAVYKKNMGVDYRLDPTHFTEYTLEQFKTEMKKAGLHVVRHEVRFGELYAVVKRAVKRK